MTIVDGARPSGHDYWAKNGRIAREQLSARQCNHPGEALAA